MTISRLILISFFTIFWALKSKAETVISEKCEHPRTYYIANGDITYPLGNQKKTVVVRGGQGFVTCKAANDLDYLQVWDRQGKKALRLTIPKTIHSEVEIPQITLRPEIGIQTNDGPRIPTPENRNFMYEESYAIIDSTQPNKPGDLHYRVRGITDSGFECSPYTCDIIANPATIAKYRNSPVTAPPPVPKFKISSEDQTGLQQEYPFRKYGDDNKDGYSELDGYFNAYRNRCEIDDFENYRTKWKTYFHSAAVEFKVPYIVVSCLSFQESEGFDANAKSQTGASGAMQITYIGFKRFHKQMATESYLDHFKDSYEAYAKKVGFKPEYVSPSLFTGRFASKADERASEIAADPKISIGQGTALLADKLDTIVNAELKNRKKSTEGSLDKKLELFTNSEKVQLFTAAVTAYNTGERGILAIIKNSKSIQNWTNDIINSSIGIEGKKHAIGIQRCMLNENARKNSNAARIREHSAPRRGPMTRIRCINGKNVSDRVVCNDNPCGCTFPSSAKDMCLPTEPLNEDSCAYRDRCPAPADQKTKTPIKRGKT